MSREATGRYGGVDAVADPLVEESALMLAGGFAEILLGWLDGILHASSTSPASS